MKIYDILTGLFSIGAIQGVQQIPFDDETMQIIVQAIIAIATLIKLFYKPKKKNKK